MKFYNLKLQDLGTDKQKKKNKYADLAKWGTQIVADYAKTSSMFHAKFCAPPVDPIAPVDPDVFTVDQDVAPVDKDVAPVDPIAPVDQDVATVDQDVAPVDPVIQY